MNNNFVILSKPFQPSNFDSSNNHFRVNSTLTDSNFDAANIEDQICHDDQGSWNA